ncbi:MAG TPA: DUF2333 family protein [Gammaproteobacteria bacterium]|jgi:hypothetical protein
MPALYDRLYPWIARGGLAGVAVLLLLMLVITFVVSNEPEPFPVQAERRGEEAIVGSASVNAAIAIGETLLGKTGGYLSNDVLPPFLFLDDMPNWEFGALVALRDLSAVLRNHYARSQSQSVEDADLARAEPQFNFQNDSWMLPATESEYRDGLAYLQAYRGRLLDDNDANAQFFARADNLAAWLQVVEKRLGSLSQRLSASVGQVRGNTNLANDPAARQSTPAPSVTFDRTPWLEVDDVFYESRGYVWALLHLFRAVESDFNSILEKKNALTSLQQIIRELEEAQRPVSSPMVLNGSGFGWVANYSLTMANYISRANAAVIDLRSLMERG